MCTPNARGGFSPKIHLRTNAKGDPLIFDVTSGEALRAGIDTKDRLDAFVGGLRNGEAAFEDEETEGRSKSLGASLSYGFGNESSEDERKILALLHTFQGFVNVDALYVMGHPDAEWCVQSVRGLTRERAIALLDRAAESGLLNAHAGGYYGIHPALPWYFRDLFELYYPAEAGDRARRAFIEAMTELGNHYSGQYKDGNSQVMSILMAEEANLLAAWRIARDHGWWTGVTSTMQGLRPLYADTGRNAAWRRLVEMVVPDFIHPATGGPLPGREEAWSMLTNYRVGLAQTERDWAEAERLQRIGVDWDRKRARPALETAPEGRNDKLRNDIRTLGVSVLKLAEIQRAKGDPACADAYSETFDLANAIGDIPMQASCAFNLGQAYMGTAHLRDLDEAERWIRKGHYLTPPGAALERGNTLALLGDVFLLRFEEARAARRPSEELARDLAEAAKLCKQALKMHPETAIRARGNVHNTFGLIYENSGDIDRALHHYRQDIRYCEEAGDPYGAGLARSNVAEALLGAGRLADARAYAEAALANYQTFGERGATQIQNTERLIAKIDKTAIGGVAHECRAV